MKFFLFFLLSGLVLAQDLTEKRVILYTNLGELSIVLEPGKAPKAVDYFISLVKSGIYDHTTITYLQKGSYVQVGSVYDRREPLNQSQRKLIHLVKEETSDLKNIFGAVAFTQVDDKPGTSETAITLFTGEYPSLDEKNTVLGHIDSGIEILKALESTPTDKNYVPNIHLEVTRAEVTDSTSASLIAKKSEENLLGKERTQASIYSMALILVISITTFFLRNRITPRVHLSLSMLTAFIAAFTLFFALTPSVLGAPWVGLVVFASLVGLYKFMNRFESSY